jgi:hypothetical protein
MGTCLRPWLQDKQMLYMCLETVMGGELFTHLQRMVGRCRLIQ